jgi:hypothetical protein
MLQGGEVMCEYCEGEKPLIGDLLRSRILKSASEREIPNGELNLEKSIS